MKMVSFVIQNFVIVKIVKTLVKFKSNLLKKYILKQKNQKSKNGYYLKTHTHSTGRKQTSFLVIR